VAPIQIGDICYLDYGEVPQVVHARLVLAEVDRQNSDFVILTPDHDVYTERLDGGNPDLVGFYRSAANGAPPAGVAIGLVYAPEAESLPHQSCAPQAWRLTTSLDHRHLLQPPLLAPTQPQFGQCP